jgi:hypothetical protein
LSRSHGAGSGAFFRLVSPARFRRVSTTVPARLTLVE